MLEKHGSMWTDFSLLMMTKSFRTVKVINTGRVKVVQIYLEEKMAQGVTSWYEFIVSFRYLI